MIRRRFDRSSMAYSTQLTGGGRVTQPRTKSHASSAPPPRRSIL